MNIHDLWPIALIIELVGGLLFFYFFVKFVNKITPLTSFMQKTFFKILLAGFIILAFFTINSLMFRFESERSESFAQTIQSFNDAKSHVALIGLGASNSEIFTYESDPNGYHVLLQDMDTNETAPCYISNDNGRVHVNDSVEEPFITYSSSDRTVDLFIPASSREIKVDKIDKKALRSSEPKSEFLIAMISSIDILDD